MISGRIMVPGSVITLAGRDLLSSEDAESQFVPVVPFKRDGIAAADDRSHLGSVGQFGRNDAALKNRQPKAVDGRVPDRFAAVCQKLCQRVTVARLVRIPKGEQRVCGRDERDGHGGPAVFAAAGRALAENSLTGGTEIDSAPVVGSFIKGLSDGETAHGDAAIQPRGEGAGFADLAPVVAGGHKDDASGVARYADCCGEGGPVRVIGVFVKDSVFFQEALFGQA